RSDLPGSRGSGRKFFIFLKGLWGLQSVEGLHFTKSQKKRKGRFRSLIRVHAVVMKPVPAPAGSRVVKRLSQLVFTQEPMESTAGLFHPSLLTRHAVRRQARRNHSAGFHRLLIEAGFFASPGIKPVGTDGGEIA